MKKCQLSLYNLVKAMSATQEGEVGQVHLQINSDLEELLILVFSVVSFPQVVYVCFIAGGLRGAARGGLVGLTLSGLYALYNNWDHLKGSSPTRY